MSHGWRGKCFWRAENSGSIGPPPPSPRPYPHHRRCGGGVGVKGGGKGGVRLTKVKACRSRAVIAQVMSLVYPQLQLQRSLQRCGGVKQSCLRNTPTPAIKGVGNKLLFPKQNLCLKLFFPLMRRPCEVFREKEIHWDLRSTQNI